MMVQWSPPEYSMLARVLDSISSLAVLEHEALQNDRHHFRDEDGAHEHQQEFRLQQNRDRGERPPQRHTRNSRLQQNRDRGEPPPGRERAGVPHKYFRWVSVVPEKAYARAQH